MLCHLEVAWIWNQSLQEGLERQPIVRKSIKTKFWSSPTRWSRWKRRHGQPLRALYCINDQDPDEVHEEEEHDIEGNRSGYVIDEPFLGLEKEEMIRGEHKMPNDLMDGDDDEYDK